MSSGGLIPSTHYAQQHHNMRLEAACLAHLEALIAAGPSSGSTFITVKEVYDQSGHSNAYLGGPKRYGREVNQVTMGGLVVCQVRANENFSN